MRSPYSTPPSVPPNPVPDPRQRGCCEVSQHNFVCGTIVRGSNGSFFSFDHRGKLLGQFASFAEASRAFRPIIFDDWTVA